MKASARGVRTSVLLDEEAHILLGTLTTPRRKGEYLSELIRRAGAEHAAQQSDGIRLLQRIEERLARIEERLHTDGLPTGQPPGQPEVTV